MKAFKGEVYPSISVTGGAHTTSESKPDSTESMNLRSEWKEFMDSVSISGARFVAKGDELPARRLIWTVLILLGFGLMSYQLIERTSYFYSYPSNTLLVTHYPKKLAFPAITICSESRYLSYKASREVADFYNAIYPPLGGFGNPTGPNFTIMDGYTPPNNDWLNTYIQLSRNLTYEGGVTWCQTGSISHCSTPRYWKTIWTEMGMCAQFNSDGDQFVTIPGMSGGLQMQTMALSQFSLARIHNVDGFRIAFTEPGEYPDMISYGIHIPPGKEIAIAIEKTEITLLPPPYGICNENVRSNFSSVYTIAGCYRACKATAAAKICGCISEAYANVSTGFPICDPRQFYQCFRLTYNSVAITTCTECDSPCREVRYAHSVTHGDFATDVLALIASFIPFPGYTVQVVKENFSFLNIYYPSLSYTEITQERAYDIFTLFCDMGGALGLLLGSTFLTVYEFFDFFIFFLVKRYITKTR